MNEEEYIREELGTRNPFTVPDGYFDHLAGRVIDRLPPAASERKPSAVVRRLRPLLYAAACAVLAIAVGAILRYSASGSLPAVAQQQEQAAYSDTYMDDMADYAMLGNDDIYASLLADL